MNAVAAERIKLFSTRSPWWCSAMAIVLVVGATGLIASAAPASYGPLPPMMVAQFLQFGMVVVMVMAAVSVTTEYRFGTIRTTFQAVPNRSVALLAKTGVVTVVAAGIGLIAGFGAWASLLLLRPDPALALTSDAQWRLVAGPALVFAVAAVLAVAVGVLLRQTAGAVALLLTWALLLENVVLVIPDVGEQINRWLPFSNAANFLIGTPDASMPFGPWGSLAYVAAISAALLAVALTVATNRDA